MQRDGAAGGEAVFHDQSMLADIAAGLAMVIDDEDVERLAKAAGAEDDLGIVTGEPGLPAEVFHLIWNARRQGQDGGFILSIVFDTLKARQDDISLQGRAEKLIRDDFAAAFLPFQDAFDRALRQHVTLWHEQDFAATEAGFEQGFFKHDVHLHVRVLHGLPEIGGPVVIAAVAATAGKHLGGEALQHGDVGPLIGKVHEGGAQGLDDVFDQVPQDMDGVWIGESVGAGAAGILHQ